MQFLIILFAKYLYLLSILISLLIVILTKKRLEIIKLAILSLPVSLILAKLLSLLIYNPRPFVVENIKPLIDHAANNGFPSDHTLLTMTLALIIFCFNKKSGIILVVLAILTGLARVAAKIHHPVDIFGSIVIAMVAVYSSFYLLNRLKMINLK